MSIQVREEISVCFSRNRLENSSLSIFLVFDAVENELAGSGVIRFLPFENISVWNMMKERKREGK